MNRDSRIYVAGHRGLAGSAIWRELERQGHTNVIGKVRTQLDLLDTAAVARFFAEAKPEYVFLAAARVGGIAANDAAPATFLYENLQIQTNIINQARLSGVKKLLFLGSSCIYPKMSPQPIKEEHLLTGPLEPTNQWYAIAKIAGIKFCQACRRQYGSDFISAMPTNLYGPNDNYDPQGSHVLPALIRRFHEAVTKNAASVTCWGSGSPYREFLHADDLASALVFLMKNYSEEEIINVGSGTDLTIKALTEIVAKAAGYKGEILWDKTKPDGTPRKLMDSSRLLAMGWKPAVDLETGVARTYAEYARTGGKRANG